MGLLCNTYKQSSWRDTRLHRSCAVFSRNVNRRPSRAMNDLLTPTSLFHSGIVLNKKGQKKNLKGIHVQRRKRRIIKQYPEPDNTTRRERVGGEDTRQKRCAE